MFFKGRCRKKVQSVEVILEFSLLDLPELAIEGILKLLPAATLCRMAGVCRELRRRCGSHHLWENLLLEKWGKVVGPDVFSAWLCSLVSSKTVVAKNSPRSDTCTWSLSCFWPVSCFQLEEDHSRAANGGLPRYTLMAFYTALESAHFWFPAQVFNREGGHVGFMLSCYDAEICYERTTNSFRARYPPHGVQTVVVEEGIPWERLRATPIMTTAYELHKAGSYDDLFPGDHVEVQWKRNSDFPYGWWYGMVGHADTCHRRSPYCLCHLEDMVWLEFNQYTHGSRWRRAAIKRKNISEEGDEAEGFYGGIRKLRTQEEISMWMQLWPKEYLE